MREYIYRIIKRSEDDDNQSKFYDFFICAVAVLSIIPLMFKGTNKIIDTLDLITVYILFLDYILRWIVADFNMKSVKGILAFFIYPITPLALLDLLSLLPSLGLVASGLRVLRIFRITKLFRYSKNFSYIANVFKREKQTFLSVLIIALGYIFLSALVMFSYEPQTFETFFDALYWATTALTTVGYGDVYPTTDIGQLISMVSSIFGIAIIALPAGIVTGGFLEEINRSKLEKIQREKDKLIKLEKKAQEKEQKRLDALEENKEKEND